MWHAQVRAIILDNAWKICVVILSVQDFYNALGCIMCTFWFLGIVRIKLECPGNARFELQIVDVPHGQEDAINGDGLFFEVQYPTYIMQGLLAYDKVIQRLWASRRIFHNIRAQVHLFTCRIVTKESSISPTFLVLKCHWNCPMILEQLYSQWVCTY
jgi:hypothetical protein